MNEWWCHSHGVAAVSVGRAEEDWPRGVQARQPRGGGGLSCWVVECSSNLTPPILSSQSQCGQPGAQCTMRRPRDPPPSQPGRSGHHQAFPPPWTRLLGLQLLLLLLVGLFAALPCVASASAGVDKRAASGGAGPRTVCGTPFTDVESSALLADVVLEGRVREKVFPEKNSPDQGGYYNVSIQVRKQVWKGKELVNRGKRARKLLLGTFRDASGQQQEEEEDSKVDNNSNSNNRSNNRRNKKRNSRSNRKKKGNGDDGVGRPGGNSASDDNRGGDSAIPLCVGEVEDGATYIFFLRTVPGDGKGRYFELSALPVKKSRRESRRVSKILKKNAAQKPVIQRLKPPRKVTSGSSVTLRCKAKGKPTPIYHWFRDGKVLKSGRGLRIKSNKRGSRLKISKVKTSSAGVYTCTASNAAGEASKDVTIKVIKAESIHKPCEKQTFCFNGGTCRYLPDLQQTFCQCPRSYEGKRCEKEVARPIKGASTLEYERVLIIVGIVIAFLVFLAICIASYFLAKRRRKRWEARRRMKQNGRRGESARLLDQTDGIVNQQPRGFPLEKETQTDDIHPPDLPPKRDLASGPRVNPMHTSTPTAPPADEPFHMNDHFPVITSTATPLLTSHPPNANSRKSGRAGSGRDSRELERRESRSRLKAVSVDDSCKDRPPSWRADGGEAAAGGREMQPLLRGSQGGPSSPEVIEMSDLSPTTTTTTTTPPAGADISPKVTSDEDQVEGLPGFLSSFSSSGQTEEPLRMNTPPRDNARAQLKTPEEQSLPAPSALADYDVPKPSAAQAANFASPYVMGDAEGLLPLGDTSEEPVKSRVLPINGELSDSGSDDNEEEEEGGKRLPLLHISEEDLNGNLSKADSMDSRSLPPVPAPEYSSEEASSPSGSFPSPPPLPAHRQRPLMMDGEGLDGYLAGGYLDDDDCGGILPHAPRGSSTGQTPPPRAVYSFDPAMDSDPDDVDQFMHGSPKKSAGSYSSAEVQQDLERRLRNVRPDQEPIPI